MSTTGPRFGAQDGDPTIVTTIQEMYTVWQQSVVVSPLRDVIGNTDAPHRTKLQSPIYLCFWLFSMLCTMTSLTDSDSYIGVVLMDGMEVNTAAYTIESYRITRHEDSKSVTIARSDTRTAILTAYRRSI
ncbi:hypothetical protein Tco_0282990 [Tanacetum coccineum]